MAFIRKLIASIIFVFFASIFTTTVFALTADGRPDYTEGTDHGLYIWRDGNGNWNLHLSAGGDSLTLAGTIVSTEQITLISAVNVDGEDVAELLDPNNLRLDFQVWNSGVDSVVFSVPENADLCLWGSTSEGGLAILGNSSTPASTAIDLTESHACRKTYLTYISAVDADTPDDPPQNTGSNATPGDRRYHPGHYITATIWDTETELMEAIKPGVAGIQRRYTWRELEPAKGVYDFSAVDADLEFLAGQGMQFVMFIEDKSFVSSNPIPEYLSDYTLPNRAGGYTVERWDPYVVSRMRVLLVKLAEHYDANPNFEGVSIAESSLGIDNDYLDANGYTPEKYRDALINILTTAAEAFSHSEVFWYMNFLAEKQEYLTEIAEVVAPLGVAMGGPDVLPDSESLKQHTYPLYQEFQGRMTLFNSAQLDSYRHLHADSNAPTKYWTPQEIFTFARDTLHLNYMFWHRKTRRSPGDSYIWTDALPTIENNPSLNP
jgi:hypothetical protein